MIQVLDNQILENLKPGLLHDCPSEYCTKYPDYEWHHNTGLVFGCFGTFSVQFSDAI